MENNWISVEDKTKLPKADGTEVIGFSPDWIDEDFNPKGTRVCFYTDNGNWISAKWVADQDSYYNDEETKPTHFMYIPEFNLAPEKCTKCGSNNFSDVIVNKTEFLILEEKRICNFCKFEFGYYITGNWRIFK